MVQLFIDGGGFMWPILFIFIIGFVFVIERLYHLFKGLSSNEEFAYKVAETVKESGIDSAKTQCEGAVGPVANLCLSALDRARLGADEAEHALDHSGSIEMASMEKNMTWISLCIATAPMLGFLGTVWGMIQAFNDIKMPNDISPAVVAGGISQALLTTAFGLIVAMIIQTFQNVFVARIDKLVLDMEEQSIKILDHLQDLESK